MPAWYFRIDGDEGGPIGQDTLLTWIMEGRLPRQALLRSEDATEWKPAQQVFPGFFPLLEQAPTGQPKGKSLVPATPLEGTGGKTPTKKLLGSAMGALLAQWPVVAGAYLVYAAINRALAEIPYAGYPVVFFLTGPIELGWMILALAVTRGGKGEVRLVLGGFRDFRRALLTGLLRTLILCVWMLLSLVIWLILMVILKPVYRDFRAWHNPVLLGCAFVAAIPSLVPFYIATLAYSLTMFLVADDCGLAPIQAIRRSKQVMVGRKAKLFVLELPFQILFVLVTVLTNAIGHLAPPGPWRYWVLTLVGSLGAVLYFPPITLCTARFFDDLHPLKVPGPPWTPDVPTPLVR